MKKRTRILILGIAMMFIMAMSGCGVNHKSPEGVVEALIKNYVSGSEKKVKQCYSQEKDTNELLQNEIDATLKYFFLSHIATLTKAINTGTSTKGPITVVNATGDAKPNVAIATASANSKLFPAAVKEIAAVFG